MTPLFYEYSFTIDGVHLVITVEWFMSQAAPTPFLVDVERVNLTDQHVTATLIQERVRDRATVIRRGIALYQEVQSRFGGNQNQRLSAP